MTDTLTPPVDRWKPPLRSPGDQVKGYYDEPVLMSGPWRWLITTYFFLGGISGASYLLAAVARRFGGSAGERVARAGSMVSLLAALPSPLLLILDLGRRARFHHMLRVFKPLSPMNTGAWALTAHSAAAGLSAWHDLAAAGALPQPLRAAGDLVPAGLVEAASAPTALYFSGYTGTLLAATAIPLWAKTPLLGPLFMASAAATGTAAVDGALALAGEEGPGLGVALAAAVALEGATELVYERRLGEVAGRPLKTGTAARWLKAHRAIGVAVPLALLASPWRRARGVRVLAAAAALAGGYCLRAAIVEGGHESARDPEAALAG